VSVCPANTFYDADHTHAYPPNEVCATSCNFYFLDKDGNNRCSSQCKISSTSLNLPYITTNNVIYIAPTEINSGPTCKTSCGTGFTNFSDADLYCRASCSTSTSATPKEYFESTRVAQSPLHSDDRDEANGSNVCVTSCATGGGNPALAKWKLDTTLKCVGSCTSSEYELNHTTMTLSSSATAATQPTHISSILSGSECRSSCPRFFNHAASGPYTCVDQCVSPLDNIDYSAAFTGSQRLAKCQATCSAKFFVNALGYKECIPQCGTLANTGGLTHPDDTSANNTDYAKYLYLENGSTTKCVRSCQAGERIHWDGTNYKCVASCPTSHKFLDYLSYTTGTADLKGSASGETSTTSAYFCKASCPTARQYFYTNGSGEFVCLPNCNSDESGTTLGTSGYFYSKNLTTHPDGKQFHCTASCTSGFFNTSSRICVDSCILNGTFAYAASGHNFSGFNAASETAKIYRNSDGTGACVSAC